MSVRYSLMHLHGGPHIQGGFRYCVRLSCADSAFHCSAASSCWLSVHSDCPLILLAKSADSCGKKRHAIDSLMKNSACFFAVLRNLLSFVTSAAPRASSSPSHKSFTEHTNLMVSFQIEQLSERYLHEMEYRFLPFLRGSSDLGGRAWYHRRA